MKKTYVWFGLRGVFFVVHISVETLHATSLHGLFGIFISGVLHTPPLCWRFCSVFIFGVYFLGHKQYAPTFAHQIYNIHFF
jgi:hypothetical protein